MTTRLHEELAALCVYFSSGELSEEEWALVQIHLAYCDSCHRNFIKTTTSKQKKKRVNAGVSKTGIDAVR